MTDSDFLLPIEGSCEAAFLAIVTHCAEDTNAALAVFLETDDERGPHKARVALRRLTSCLDAFSPILRRKPARRLRKLAKRLFRALGQVRDSDVYVSGKQGQKGHAVRLAANLRLREALRARLRKDRAVAVPARVVAAVQPGAGAYRSSARAVAVRQGPIRDLARAALQEAWARCATYGVSVRAISADDLHDFRKDMKTLRYLADFFTPLFPLLDGEPFQTDFRTIQDSLGFLNDARVALEVEGRKPGKKPLPAVKAEMDRAELAWSRLVAAPAPWG